VIAGFAAYIVLGEVLYPLQVLGGIGVIVAVVLLQIGREKAAPSTPLEIRQPPHPTPLPPGERALS